MKKTVLLAVLALTGVTAFGQATVLFNNRYSNATAVPPVAIDAPVTIFGTTTKLDGGSYMGQLYAGASATSLSPIGVAVAFRTGAGAGYITGGDITVPGVAAGGTAFVQLRAWSTASGSSYDAALSAGGTVGTSSVLTLTLGGAGTPPGPGAPLVGLTAFTVSAVPEPATIALGLLGVAGLLIRRRK